MFFDCTCNIFIRLMITALRGSVQEKDAVDAQALQSGEKLWPGRYLWTREGREVRGKKKFRSIGGVGSELDQSWIRVGSELDHRHDMAFFS